MRYSTCTRNLNLLVESLLQTATNRGKNTVLACQPDGNKVQANTSAGIAISAQDALGLQMAIIDGFELIAQGAEARVYKGVYLGKLTLLKERFEKKYRHADLDARLTKDRIRAECRAMVRAKTAGVVTPAIYFVQLERRCIYMEYIDNAMVLKDFIEGSVSKGVTNEHFKFITRGVGILVARLHNKNIIHGDLTTSNILLKNVDEELNVQNDDDTNSFIIIDFGLARVESSVEDKAVDLYVLERSLLSAHSEVPSLFSNIFETYQKQFANKKQCNEIVSKYKDVQMRGRKRLMVG